MSRPPSSGKLTQVSHTPEKLRLKDAFKEVVDGCSGLDGAAASTRVEKSTIGRYTSPTEKEFAPLDVVMDLEKLARNRPGWPHVTRRLARDLGFVLVERPQVEAPNCPALHAALTASMQRSADLHKAMVDALADGVLERSEGELLQRLSMEAAEENLRANALAKRIAEEC